MYTEICALIRATIEGDSAKGISYARLLATNLRKEGKSKEADRVLRALGDLPPSENIATLDALTPAPAPVATGAAGEAHQTPVVAALSEEAYAVYMRLSLAASLNEEETLSPADCAFLADDLESLCAARTPHPATPATGAAKGTGEAAPATRYIAEADIRRLKPLTGPFVFSDRESAPVVRAIYTALLAGETIVPMMPAAATTAAAATGETTMSADSDSSDAPLGAS